MLKENAVELAYAAIPRPSRAEMLALLERALAQMARHGLTAGAERARHRRGAGGSMRELERAGQADRAPLHRAQRGRLPPTRSARGRSPTTGELVRKAVELKRPLPLDRWCSAGAVKIVADGVIEAQTASMLEPYANAPATRGLPNYTPAALAALVRALDAAGLQIWTHAIGDAAVRRDARRLRAGRPRQRRRASGATASNTSRRTRTRTRRASPPSA